MARSSCSSTRRLLLLVFLSSLAGMCLLLPASKVCAQQAKTPQPPPAAAAPTATPPTIQDVQPRVVQPDGILTLVFSKPDVKPMAVKVGNVDAPILPPIQTTGPNNIVKVKVAVGTPLGQQAVAVTLADNPAASITSAVTVAPLVQGLKPNTNATMSQVSRVGVAGGEIILQFEKSIPAEIRHLLLVNLVIPCPSPSPGASPSPAANAPPVASPTPTPTPCRISRRVDYRMPEDSYLVLQIPSDLPLNTYTVEVTVGDSDAVLDRRPQLGVLHMNSVYWRTSLNLLVPIVILYAFFRWFYKVPQGQTRYTFLGRLLLEPENQTYSLSRFQFLAWLVVIVWCYIFLYFAHGFVEQAWSYPALGNATYAFLISLGTLLASQVTTKTRGPKGAGEIHPSLADLIVHGGVFALDRVQQLAWTLIAMGMFVRITVMNFGTANGLPDIPNELLALMGLSSAGYLGGKMIRGPGPVIDQVTPRAGSVILNIRGKHISKDAFVWVDGVNQPKEKIAVKTSDPDDPKFATEIELTLDTSMDLWFASEHVITVINADAQRADWRSGPQIVSVTAGAVAAGKAPLTITGAHLTPSATVELADTPSGSAQQDPANPNLFTATVEEAWLTSSHLITVTDAQQKASFTYTPSAAAGDGNAGNAGGGDAAGGGNAGGGDAAGGGNAGGGDAAGGGNAGGGDAADGGDAGGGNAAGGEDANGGGDAAGGEDATGDGGTAEGTEPG